MNREISIPVTRFEPGFLRGPFQSLHRQIDRLFEDFLPATLRTGEEIIVPRIDIDEKDDVFSVSAELPGVDKADIDVRIADNMVLLKGEKRREHEEKDADHHLVERSYGAFQRSFTLPCDVDAAKADAEFKDGVLKLKLPKAPAAKQKEKKISIR
jgi:HSP20 family protein